MQALVLTHEEEAEEATLPYASIVFRPLVALEMVGRCANREPACHPHHAVYYFWKDPTVARACFLAV